MKINLTLLFSLIALVVFSQDQQWKQKFEQLGEKLPTPNEYRTGSGAPGPKYWQQSADYKIKVKLDDKNQKIFGDETITYSNNSPESLTYLWVQLDQNRRAKDSNTPLTTETEISNVIPAKTAAELTGLSAIDGGFNIESLSDKEGNSLKYVVNKTMMRIDLPKPMHTGESFIFNIKWWYNINDRMIDDGRSGFEYFPEEDNYIYAIAQFFPRMAVFDDYEGWQNKQFLGRGEFALTFGDYEVEINVPSDHIVAATGMLQNPEEVLTEKELERFAKAKTSFDKPVIIVTEKEVIKKEKNKSKEYSKWVFKAENVRDFAFASSRKFIWDAQAVKVGKNTPLAMSFYPKEGNPLWEEESTKAVKNTLEVYSKYTIDYPYPVAISVHTADIGMEYPMICFNFGRPENDGKFSRRTKYGMISVIIHEVGHNFFPMIINSDERQWTWMDEGLNTFVQYRTQVEAYENFPSRRGPAENIVNYMKGNKLFIRPIMTNSEQIMQFGDNAYSKPASALTILRETVMGPELFDKAFKTYAERWAFKHPKPADFFRTMEDASAIDLDWFWRGWFYSTDHVDLSIDQVKWYKVKEENVQIEKRVQTSRSGNLNNSQKGNKSKDFNNGPSYFTLSSTPDYLYPEYKNRLNDQKIIDELSTKNFYEITFKNIGGLVMPIILEFTFSDGSTQLIKIPAEIWRKNEYQVSKVFTFDKEVINIVMDPNKETADTNKEDNAFPRIDVESKFDQFKKGK